MFVSTRNHTLTWDITNFRRVLLENSDVFTSEQNSDLLDAILTLKFKIFGVDRNLIVIYFTTTRKFLAEVTLYYHPPPSVNNQYNYHQRVISQPEAKIISSKTQKYVLANENVLNEIGAFQLDSSIQSTDTVQFELNITELCLNNNESQLEYTFSPDDQIYNKGREMILGKFNELLTSEKHSDVDILSSDGQKVKAHKIILKCCSPVFEAMFTHDMSESVSNVVEIKDLTADVIKEMLAFMYTGIVLNLQTLDADLLAAAEKYQIDGLKEVCEISILNKLNKENALQGLLLATKYNSNTLKDQIFNFIKKSGGLNALYGPDDVEVLPASLLRELILKNICHH